MVSIFKFVHIILRTKAAMATLNERIAKDFVWVPMKELHPLHKELVQVQVFPRQTSTPPIPQARVVFSVSSVFTQALFRPPHSWGR